MSEVTTRRRWLRPAPLREFDSGERHATWLELFFDLCFVAAVAALAAGLHDDPSWTGLARFALLFVPVWWAWMEFTWFASAFDNDDAFYRVAMFAAMLGVIVVAATIGHVGDGDSDGFVLAYAGLQLVVAALFARSIPAAGAARGFALRYAAGDLAGGLIWLASLAVAPPARYWLWVLAMAALLTAPPLAVRSFADQAHDSYHIPERYGLFTIIVLGESVVAVVAGLVNVRLTPAAAVTGALGFTLAAAIWWLYFEFVKPIGLSRDRLGAAFLWGYGHLAVYAGIAAASVGVEFAIEKAAVGEALPGPARAMLAGGIAAFLLATVAIHAVGTGAWGLVLTTRMLTAAAVVGLAAAGLAPLPLTAALAAVVVAEVVLEALRTGPQPQEAEA
jgi:low temperature requirement protein LtrA